MHQLDAFLRWKLPSYTVVLRVKMAAFSEQCNFDEALQFAKETDPDIKIIIRRT